MARKTAAAAAATRSGPNEPEYVPGRALTLPQAASLLQESKLVLLDKQDYIPIRVLRAMQVVFDQDDDVNHHQQSAEQLQAALRRTGGLVFTPPPLSPEELLQKDDLTPEERQFYQRMQRLRLRNEQTKYQKLTTNLGSMTVPQKDDGITTKSMTYAASIGLNMIVAPLSFGVFMYFFAGAVLDRFFPSSSSGSKNGSDIKKVIAGVVSGVIMLFIEMLLFVIRTHEMDKALRRKERKSGNQGPFGYYKSTTSKTFKDR